MSNSPAVAFMLVHRNITIKSGWENDKCCRGEFEATEDRDFRGGIDR
jgi:hypothetical protein